MRGGPKVVVVDGPIAVGKTTMSRMLAAALGPDTLYLTEPDDRVDPTTGRPTNPYLDRFYADKARWAFEMQAFLLGKRYRYQKLAQAWADAGRGDAVMDRSYYFDTSFAHLQLARGDMDRDSFDNYATLYHEMSSEVLLPTVCVWLDADPKTCNRRVAKRIAGRPGRECEHAIDEGYLADLNAQIASTVVDLASCGVRIVKRDWSEDRDGDALSAAVRDVADEVKLCEPRRTFLDHRRVL